MSICLATKGRIGNPEATMTWGVICKRGLFQIYATVKAKWVFKREKVNRVFKRKQERVYGDD
jgi:hypothetical protein